MHGAIDPATALELRTLQYGYGIALDSRDSDALRAVFHLDAVFRAFPPDSDQPFIESTGDRQLAMMVDAIAARYAKTMHVMSNATSSVHEEQASGSVYCMAHHVIIEDGSPRMFVVYLRYEDTFRRGADGAWRIAQRDARFLWTEDDGTVIEWGDARTRGGLG